ncbi:MAG: VOC family protein [Roseiflexus sp.]|nr:VOC family protein [Roseiflexus sp.]MCS7290223.1 VOC family protein [Roseiflexus sp.]MDW8233623.1 VOC family protein [Roseiflexaceae bacterium]
MRDVPSAASFFRDVVGLTVRVEDARFAELDGGAITIMLSPGALVPVQEAAGVILHIQVEDVESAIERARHAGVTVVLEPTRTDWGTESAMIAGPEGIIVDFYRWVGPHQLEGTS